MVVGGTSAVAPMAIGLIMRLNALLSQPVGFLQPTLYESGTTVCRDVVSGTNGAYSAGPGWDCCSGFGSPNGIEWLAMLKGKPSRLRPNANSDADTDPNTDSDSQEPPQPTPPPRPRPPPQSPPRPPKFKTAAQEAKAPAHRIEPLFCLHTQRQ